MKKIQNNLLWGYVNEADPCVAEMEISSATDLSKAFPEKTRELYSLLKQWQKEVKAEFPVPNPGFNAEKRFEWGKHPDTK
jgi:arylsulfatase A